MRSLVSLYPAAWRERYEVEFIALLADRRPSGRDRLDIVRGAVDARLQQFGARPPVPIHQRVPGLVALGGGLAWLAAYATATWNMASWGATPWAVLMPTAIILMLASLPSDYHAISRRAVVISVFALAAACVLSLATSGEAGPAINAWLAAILLLLAASRAGLGPVGRMLVLLLGVGIPVIVGAFGAIRVFTPWTEALLFALVLPFGVTWAALGVYMTLRGAPTLRPRIRPSDEASP